MDIDSSQNVYASGYTYDNAILRGTAGYLGVGN